MDVKKGINAIFHMRQRLSMVVKLRGQMMTM